jgi:HSP20 family molecular chaperone IbpA
MSINDMEKIKAQQISFVKQRQNREIAKLQDNHEAVKAELRKSHSDEIIDLQDENSRQLATEHEKKEKVLGQMKNQIDETKKMTDKYISELKGYTSKVKRNEQEKLTEDRETIRANNEQFLEEQNYRFSEQQKKVVEDHQNILNELNENKHEQISNSQAHFQNKLNNQSEEFNRRFTNDSNRYRRMKEDQDSDFSNERTTSNLRQQIEMSKRTNAYNESLEVREKQFKKAFGEQNISFEKTYADNLEVRNSELNQLEKLNLKIEEKMKADLQEKLKTKIKRSDDSFYRFTELDAKIKAFDDRVEISVEIPEHSKSDVQLTINNKEASIHFNRRYEDNRVAGNLKNKLHKVESFTTTIPTPFILDSKSLKSSYDDGIMTYTIKKA